MLLKAHGLFIAAAIILPAALDNILNALRVIKIVVGQNGRRRLAPPFPLTSGHSNAPVAGLIAAALKVAVIVWSSRMPAKV